ncbi:MAG: formylmethanofuran dehydrogenase subunit C [Planctomycetaceae bacterium]
MPLLLRLHHPLTVPLEVDRIQMDDVCTRSAQEVAEMLIFRGNKQLPVGEFFDVQGSASEDRTIIWQGDCSRVKKIGAKLNGGTMRVEGSAGMHLGAAMTAGSIVVDGNVDDWAGAEMHGGHIRIRGSAGNSLGAGYPGARRGMTGGTILVDGNVGDNAGQTMRRGLIAIAGNVGHSTGHGMIAGTILCLGRIGQWTGAGMKRGTIGCFGEPSEIELLPTFQMACQYRPVFLQILWRHLKSLDFDIPSDLMNSPITRHCGDLITTGQGEILTR